MMKMIFMLAFLISCSKEKSDEVKHEIPINKFTPSVDNGTPGGSIGDQASAPRVGDRFLIHTSDVSNIRVDASVFFVDLDSSLKGIEKLPWVGGYVSVGSFEPWRKDADELKPYRLGKMKGWDEYWLDVRKPEVLVIMKKRIDRIKSLGLKGFYTDNSDIMNHESVIKKDDNIKYLKAISEYAHSNGLLIFMNNGLEMIKDTIGLFDGYINEQCEEYKECDYYSPVENKYPVYRIEYESKNCKPRSGHTVMYATGLGSEKFKRWCDDYNSPVKPTASASVTPAVLAPTIVTPFTMPTKKVFLPDGIDEASGMVWSAHHNAFIIHNDGQQGHLFVVSKEGKLLKTVKTKLPFDDFEAISLFEGKLYLGDIGNNAVDSKQKRIHVLNEKDFTFSETISVKTKEPFNAEGLAVTKDGMFISEKTYSGKTSRFFKYAQGQLAELPKLTIPLIGDISINSKGELALIHVGAGEILIGEKKLKIKELGQSESMCWIDDNHIAFTSEGESSEIITIEVK